MGDLIPFRKRTKRSWTRAEDYGAQPEPMLGRTRRWLPRGWMLGGWTPWIALAAVLAVWQFGFVDHRALPQQPAAAPAPQK